RPLDALGDLHRGPAQDLGVQLVGAALDLARDLVEEPDDLVAVDREAVARGLALEGIRHAALPVDERAVDVEGDPLDAGGEGHERRNDAMPRPSARLRRRSWTCSSTRASCCSSATA